MYLANFFHFICSSVQGSRVNISCRFWGENSTGHHGDEREGGTIFSGPHFKGNSESAVPWQKGANELVWLEMLGG